LARYAVADALEVRRELTAGKAEVLLAYPVGASQSWSRHPCQSYSAD
jgi:hypothetical protein